MKALRTVVILLILFGLPAGSWYFLKYGFNWRKDKIATLDVKAHFLRDIDWTEEERAELYPLLFYKTSVIHAGNTLTEEESQVIDQFRNAHTFQWVNLTGAQDSLEKLSSKDVIKQYRGLETLLNDPVFSNAEYMLLDTALQIRQVYNRGQEKALGLLIEDISIITPRKKEKDIGIRNKEE